jgi:hypothetical protein
MNRHLQVIVAAGLLMVSLSASALRSLKVEGFTDPDYKGYTFRKAVILVQKASNDSRTQIEERLAKGLKDHGVEAVSYRSLFPPTRNWTADETNAVLAREQINAVVIVTVGASAASVIPVATQTFSHATVSGNAYDSGSSTRFNATGTSDSTSYNLVSAHSAADFSAVLIDATTGHTVWYADITTKAAGTLFVGEKGDDKAVVKGVVEGLEKDGHFAAEKK